VQLSYLAAILGRWDVRLDRLLDVSDRVAVLVPLNAKPPWWRCRSIRRLTSSAGFWESAAGVVLADGWIGRGMVLFGGVHVRGSCSTCST